MIIAEHFSRGVKQHSNMTSQHKGQTKKEKRANNDLQSTTQKTKDQATQVKL
jgi:hypothetical protein